MLKLAIPHQSDLSEEKVNSEYLDMLPFLFDVSGCIGVYSKFILKFGLDTLDESLE